MNSLEVKSLFPHSLFHTVRELLWIARVNALYIYSFFSFHLYLFQLFLRVDPFL